MIDLLIDIGNSRIKLALVDNHDYEYLGAFPTTEIRSEASAHAFLQKLDFNPEHIYISSVANPALEMELRTVIASKWNILPVFMSTQATCCGITNGYQHAFKLGVDRWMALMGAQTFTHDSFIVIDSGTALTVDSVYEGKHQGGFIVPGLQTLRSSLMHKTAQLDETCTTLEPISEVNREVDFLARDTQSAICGGTLYMVASFINQVIFDIQAKLDQPVKVYFTGGDGQLLSGLIDVQSEYIEDLVLLGIFNVKENIKKG